MSDENKAAGIVCGVNIAAGFLEAVLGANPVHAIDNIARCGFAIEKALNDEVAPGAPKINESADKALSAPTPEVRRAPLIPELERR